MSDLSQGRTAWVCDDCFRKAATGADCSQEDDGRTLGLIDAGVTVVPGILDGEHECESRWIGHRSIIGCGEEERDYETGICEGCGSTDPGGRRAVTVWTLGN